jgi:hypothetical protein
MAHAHAQTSTHAHSYRMPRTCSHQTDSPIAPPDSPPPLPAQIRARTPAHACTPSRTPARTPARTRMYAQTHSDRLECRLRVLRACGPWAAFLLIVRALRCKLMLIESAGFKTDPQHATFHINAQHAACGMHRAPCSIQRPTCAVRMQMSSIYMQHATCRICMQHAACSTQHSNRHPSDLIPTSYSVQGSTCNTSFMMMQHATY